MPALLSGTKGREKDSVTPSQAFSTPLCKMIPKIYPKCKKWKSSPIPILYFPCLEVKKAWPKRLNQPSCFGMISPAQCCTSALRFVLVNTLTFKQNHLVYQLSLMCSALLKSQKLLPQMETYKKKPAAAKGVKSLADLKENENPKSSVKKAGVFLPCLSYFDFKKD